MMNKNFLLKFIIPSFKDKSIFSKTLKAVIVQTHKPTEIVIVDSSNNHPIEFLSISIKKIIKLITQKNGSINCRNIALKYFSNIQGSMLYDKIYKKIENIKCL